MIDVARASIDDVLDAYRATLPGALEGAGGRYPDLSEDQVVAEARVALDGAISVLCASTSDAPPKRSSLDILGGEQADDAHGVPSLLTYRLQTLLADALWETVSRRLPQEWPVATAPEVRRQLSSALSTTLGGDPWQLAQQMAQDAGDHRQQLRRAFSRILSMQEEQRRQIARDVHDVLAQALAGARFRTDTVLRLLPKSVDEAAAETAEAQELIEYTLSHVRDIIFDLRPIALDRFGLRAAIEDYAARLQRNGGLDIAISGNGDPQRLDDDLETSLFRIVQDAFGHILTHGGAKAAKIDLQVDSEMATLIVEAEGSDIDAADLFREDEPGHHVGLLAMRERAQLSGGSLKLARREGGGTRIEVNVPIRNGGA